MKKVKKINNSNTITAVRSLIALSYILTLLFTSIDDLFPKHHIEKLALNIQGHSIFRLNYFLWFDNLYVPYFLSLILLIIIALGFVPRIMCFIHAWITYSIFYSMLVVEGGDQICAIMSLLLIPISLLDERLNGWYSKKIFIKVKNKFLLYNAYVSIIIIKLQIAILYLNAGISKFYAPEWTNGTAVYYWFNDVIFGAPKWLSNSLVGYLFINDISVSIINWGVMILEIFLFVSLFLKQKYKYLLFTIGFLFHFSIFLIHGLATFWISMTAALIIYLFNAEISISKNINNVKKLIFKTIKNEKYIYRKS